MAETTTIDPRQIYPNRAIYLDYLAGAEKLVPFFTHFPANEQALLARAARTTSQCPDSAGLSQALLEYNRSISAGPAALKNAQLLAQPQTLAVVAGQQAGFAGGPLYDVYKAATAVKLAQHLARAIGKAVVPIFWIASEDSNISEINHTAWMDRTGQLQRIRAELPETRRQISTLPVSPSALDAFAQLTELLPDSEFRQTFQSLYEPHLDEPWPRWFARIYARLFAEHGLVMLEPHVVYPFAGPFFSRAISHLPDLQRAFADQTADLSVLGYEPQITPDRRTMLYLIEKDCRQSILPEDNHLLVDSVGRYSPTELSELAARQPELFSCSAMLRPLAQDFLLPTVACVAGPGEIAYHAQLARLYQQLEITQPVIWPRASLTLIEPNTTRLLNKSGLDLEQLLEGPESPIPPARAQADTQAGQSMQRLAQQIKINLAQLTEKLSSQDGSLEKFSAKISGRLQRDLDRLLERAMQSFDNQNNTTQQQRQRARTRLLPRSQPQERVFGLFGYLVYYGQDVLDQIVNRIDIFDFQHQLLYLDFSSSKTRPTSAEQRQ